MENLIRSYDKDNMKLAMLKHEQTFKEQVYELHRLYRVQKTLMKALMEDRGDLRRPFIGREGLYDDDGIELTLGLGPTMHDARTRKRGGGTSSSFSSSTTTGSSGQEKSRTSYGSDGKGGDGGEDNVEEGRDRPRMQKQHPPWLIQAVLSMNQNSL
ncbi:hypothetical protein MLD38_005068 [Melastoma candidum]|uniref:Uncharacterized protein n=1 Tax=Melastoma candidum TaxID=119954 RepID=A0ACB9S9M0_9MYRT|nr:hypothetical protein MLD38_005068 [Melastoma candidum]